MDSTFSSLGEGFCGKITKLMQVLGGTLSWTLIRSIQQQKLFGSEETGNLMDGTITCVLIRREDCTGKEYEQMIGSLLKEFQIAIG